MSARYTPVSSVQALDFEDFRLLIPHRRLVSGFFSSNQRFASGFLQIPPRDGHPCRAASSSPCRACMGLEPIRKCALPGAPKQVAFIEAPILAALKGLTAGTVNVSLAAIVGQRL